MTSINVYVSKMALGYSEGECEKLIEIIKKYPVIWQTDLEG